MNGKANWKANNASLKKPYPNQKYFNFFNNKSLNKVNYTLQIGSNESPQPWEWGQNEKRKAQLIFVWKSNWSKICSFPPNIEPLRKPLWTHS